MLFSGALLKKWNPNSLIQDLNSTLPIHFPHDNSVYWLAVLIVCCWEIITSEIVVFFLFVGVAEQLRTRRKETGILLKSFFIFGVYDNFAVRICFLEPVEITMLSGQGIRRISGIILANCKSSVSRKKGLRIRHVCLWSVGMSIWRCDERETLCITWPTDTYAPTDHQYVKENEEEFLFGAWKITI